MRGGGGGHADSGRPGGSSAGAVGGHVGAAASPGEGQRAGVRAARADARAYERGVKLHFIEPGKPVQNAFVESFNGKMRDECLNEHRFGSLAEARKTIEAWRR